MRIIIPNYCPPDSFVDNVSFTLRAMGHEVLTMAENPPWSKLVKVRKLYCNLRSTISNYFTPEEKWLLKNVRLFRPAMLLALTQCIQEECLHEIKKIGVKIRVAWWGDAPGNMQRLGLLTREWDKIYLKDPFGVVKFKMVGLNASLLHEAMNPVWHKVVTQQKNDSLAVVGNYYGYRQFITKKLLSDKIPLLLYGSAPPIWSLPEVKKRHLGQYIVKTKKSQVFGEALACLNSTHLLEGDSLNCRAFEIAGAGGLQIIEARSIIKECFEPGQEVLTYNTYEELIELIKRAKSYPQDMKLIRQRSANRALAQHTYEHRLSSMLSDVLN